MTSRFPPFAFVVSLQCRRFGARRHLGIRRHIGLGKVGGEGVGINGRKFFLPLPPPLYFSFHSNSHSLGRIFVSPQASSEFDPRCASLARIISHSFASLTCEILFLPLEHKIHIFSPPGNILYVCESIPI